VIQDIDEVKPQLQIALFANPGYTIVFQHAGIYLEHAWIAVDVAWLSSFCARRRNGEIGSREQPVYVG
jgi:hypothetical protein